ncbi:MAG: type IVB secretion system protein IcmH/DotU [bacterium]
MNLQTIDSSRAQDLSNLCADFFSLILHLRTQNDFGHPENLRHSLTQHFESMERKAKEFRLEAGDIVDVKFALTAFLDETILNSRWREKEAWRARPLQLVYFKTNLAGEKFFERLDRIWEDRKNKAALLEVYYLCLILGFEGKFKLQDKEKLYKQMNEIALELRESRAVAEYTLSPNAQNLESARRQHGPPSWLIVLLCLCVGLLFYAIMSEWSFDRAGAVLEQIGTIKPN